MSSEVFSFALKWMKHYDADPFVPFTPWALRRFIFLGLLWGFLPLPLLVIDLFLKGTDIVIFAEAFITCYHAIWRLIIIGRNKQHFMTAYKAIDNFICNNTKKDSELDKLVMESHKLTTFMFKYYRMVVIFTVLTYLCKPLYFGRILPAGYHLQCDLENNICFLVNWVYQCFSTAYVVFFIVCFDGVVFGFISFACIELKAIKYELINLIDDRVTQTDDVYMKKISRLVAHHSNVLDYIRTLNELFRYSLFQQMAASTVGICVGLFEINLEGRNLSYIHLTKYIAFMAAYYMELFTYCCAGQYLMDQTVTVANAAYSCNWHFKHLPKATKGLIMIIRRSNKATKLTIGNMYELNLELFAGIARSSFSVCALLQTMYEQ